MPVGAGEARALFAGLEDADSLAVAVSGGPDSLALALLLTRWQRDHAPHVRLHGLIVDHGLRDGSDQDARHSESMLSRIGLTADVLTLNGLPQGNLHHHARAARYDAMTDWMAQNGFAVLATAHHRDDQIETVMMRLARDPAAGLAGIARNGWWADRRVVRPLLDLPKARLAATLEGSGLDPLSDPANTDPRFERARVRAELAHNPCPASALDLLRKTRAARRVEDTLNAAAHDFIPHMVELCAHGFARLDLRQWRDQPRDLRLWVLRALVRDLGGNLAPVRRDKLTALEARLFAFATDTGGDGFAGATLGGVRICAVPGADRATHVSLFREAGRRPLPPLELIGEGSCLFDRRLRVTLRQQPAARLRVTSAGAANTKLVRDWLPCLAARHRACVLASVPVVYRGETPLFPAVSEDACAAGLSCEPLGLRFGRHRFTGAC